MARPAATISPPTSTTRRIHGTSALKSTPAARRARRAATVSATSGRARLWTRTMASRSESTAARISGRNGSPEGPGCPPGSGQDKGPDLMERRIDLGPHHPRPDRGGDDGGELQHRPVPEDGQVDLPAHQDDVVVDDGRCIAAPHHHTDPRHPRHLAPVETDLNVLPESVEHGDRGEVVGG